MINNKAIKITSIGLLMLVSLSAMGAVKIFEANYDVATWQVRSSALRCELQHDIPEYGTLEIIQKAGSKEFTRLKVLYGRAIEFRRAEVIFAPPVWQANKKDEKGWSFQFGKYNEPVLFSSRQSRRLLDALDHGLYPIIWHRDNTHRIDDIAARISPVSFQKAYQKFNLCQASLIPVSFNTVKNSNIYFETGSARLDEEATEWLGYVLPYLQDPSLRRVELGGYTDSIGNFRANHKLASARVEQVRKFLLDSGINEKILKLRVYGEQRAIAKNTTIEGRALNRRVNIKIYR